MENLKLMQKKLIEIKDDLSYDNWSEAIKNKTGKYISPSSLNKYVKIERRPPITVLETIAKYAGIQVQEFFSDKKNVIDESKNIIEQVIHSIRNNKVFSHQEQEKLLKNLFYTINNAGLAGEFVLKEDQSLDYQSKTISLPIVGTVPAGEPILSEENIEGHMPMPSMFVKGDNDFILKVRGDSMEDVNISDGDLILVHQQPTAENGQTVIARINGEVTCKRFYRTNGTCRLEPANHKYKPIDCKEVEIIGIVTKVIKEVF